MSESNHVKQFLMDNPRMIGVLFAMLLMLAQAGNVSAGWGCTIAGP